MNFDVTHNFLRRVDFMPLIYSLNTDFSTSDDNRPVCMVNLMKYKKHAEYEDGRKTNLSGREAYAIYGAEVAKLLAKRNAKPVFSGQ